MKNKNNVVIESLYKDAFKRTKRKGFIKGK
jgi:hypothetical protein